MKNLRGLLVFGLSAAIAIAQQGQVVVRDPGALPSPDKLTFPALSEIKIPKPTVATLSNGMKVYMLEDHELPTLRATMLVRTGNLFDPKDKLGLATLTGITMRSGGTAKMSGDQLDETLESVAASVETEIGESTGTARFHCLKENTDAVLAVFHDVVTSPAFRDDKIALAKTQLHGAISRRNDDAQGIASRELLRQVYGRDTPYGGEIEHATVDAVTKSDIQAFYKRYFFPSNILMAVYGDFSTPDMQKKLEAVFGSWTVRQETVPAFPPVTAKPDPGIFWIQKSEVEQTFIEAGHLGGELRDKDFPALSVAAGVFGSGFSSRLIREVRTRLGYAYSIGSDWEAGFDHPGLFHIGGSTKSETTTETIQAVLTELDKLRGSEVTDQELKTAKDATLNSLVFEFERPSSTLARLLTYDYFGYPVDFLVRYQKAVEAVTKADVLRVAKEYFQPSKLTIIAVGNGEKLGAPLTNLHLPVKKLDIRIPGGAKHETR